jgi:hypothetical protein
VTGDDEDSVGVPPLVAGVCLLVIELEEHLFVLRIQSLHGAHSPDALFIATVTMATQ